MLSDLKVFESDVFQKFLKNFHLEVLAVKWRCPGDGRIKMLFSFISEILDLFILLAGLITNYDHIKS